jgi:membrane protease YdiL (CAAX protease family)
MKLAGIAGSGTPMFQIIDTPNKPQLPVAPNRPMLMIIGLVISLVFGLFVVFIFELPRLFLLNDEQDIEYYLGAPVIALIPETTTPIERSRNRRLKWTRGLIFLVLAAGMIPALIVVLNRVGIFQIIGSR